MKRLYRLLFHLVCRKRALEFGGHDESFEAGLQSTKEYFDRFDNLIEVKDKRVFDVGCGYGGTCIYVAEQGAKRVVGIDIDEERLETAKEKLRMAYPGLKGKVQYKLVSADEDAGEEKFDVILSKDSFEHISEPEKFIASLANRLAPGGLIVIGFGPLGKSPHGGHIKYMTRLPWAHLLVPEWVIMEERRRFRPQEEARTFGQIRGGLNKMTLKRCLTIMSRQQFECLYLKTNVYRENRAKWLLGKTCNVLRRIPFCRELFTINLYGIWRLRSRGGPP